MDLESSELLSEMRNLTPRHFEQFVADVWQERQGWQTEVTDKGSDRGRDVIGYPPSGGPQTVVQCKRYGEGNKVRSSEIQRYASLHLDDEVGGVTVVTTSSFTTEAKRVAEARDVKCLDSRDLTRLVTKYNAVEILEWYANGKPSDW